MVAKGFTTCLWFDGQAEEAANHYVSIFKDSRIGQIMRAPEGTPGATPGQVLTVEFEANGQKFVGLNGGPLFTFNESISFEVRCADQEEVDYYWNRLLEGGGEESQCGWLKDRFGVSWQVTPEELIQMFLDPDPAKTARVNEAMMSMRKLDLAALRKAYAGE
ncbi:VOC family protein [Spirillospora sp. NPDC052242]